MTRALRASAACLAFALSTAAQGGGAVIYGGAALGSPAFIAGGAYGPGVFVVGPAWAGPGVVGPVWVAPGLVPLWWSAPTSAPPRLADDLPSCYRAGRCRIEELYLYRAQPERLERRAPTAPDASGVFRPWPGPHAAPLVPPTPEENIMPAYRDKSLPRDGGPTAPSPIAN